MNEPEDINMAVAAAIGVGAGTESDMDGASISRQMPNGMNIRLQNKMKSGLHPNFNPALGEINRSIEKMRIGAPETIPTGNNLVGTIPCRGSVSNTVGGQASLSSYDQRRSIPSSTQTLMPNPNGSNHRRDSNWTNSTEGYGSMRSEQSMLGSRRCSEISAMSQTSNVSTRALMNSPWDPISAGSSRRSSLVTGGGNASTTTETSAGPAISQHLGRLRKKAQTVQQEHQLQSLTPNATQSENLRNMSGRASAMSDCSVPASATQLHNTHL